MSRAHRCAHWSGGAGRYCNASGARRYVIGWRCPRHTPAALAGRDEPPFTLPVRKAR